MIYFDVHTHKLSSIPDIVSIISSFPELSDGYSSIGIHPWHIGEDYKYQISLIDSIASKQNILAIGEIGLDKVCMTDFELQKKVFINQLELASNHKKPIIIHCVKAFDEILNLTKNFKQPIIMHGFIKGYELAKQFTDRGIFLSFGKSLFDEYSKSPETFKKAPLEKIFLETDESDFTIQELYKRASEIKGIELDFLQSQIEQNFRKVFNGLKQY